jgi:hypothetical protein
MVMSFNQTRRREMIEILIGNDENTILHDDYGPEYLWNLLSEGFKGYENYTDDELTQEMNERDLWTNWFKEE